MDTIHFSSTDNRTACDYSHAMPHDVTDADLQNDEYEEGYALGLITCVRCHDKAITRSLFTHRVDHLGSHDHPNCPCT